MRGASGGRRARRGVWSRSGGGRRPDGGNTSIARMDDRPPSDAAFLARNAAECLPAGGLEAKLAAAARPGGRCA